MPKPAHSAVKIISGPLQLLLGPHFSLPAPPIFFSGPTTTIHFLFTTAYLLAAKFSRTTKCSNLFSCCPVQQIFSCCPGQQISVFATLRDFLVSRSHTLLLLRFHVMYFFSCPRTLNSLAHAHYFLSFRSTILFSIMRDIFSSPCALLRRDYISFQLCPQTHISFILFSRS